MDLPYNSPQDHAQQHNQPTIGVICVNLGTPAAPTRRAVRTYLAEFLSDRRIVEIPRLLWWFILYGFILPLRPQRSARLYQKIWMQQGSPLMVYTQRLIARLQQHYHSYRQATFSVDYAMRYGQPSIAQVLSQISKKNVRHLLVLPLFPQYSATTTASVFDAVSRYFQQQRWLPQIQFIMSYHDHPLYITALIASIKQQWQATPASEKLLISFHGIPQRNFELGDPYYCYCHKTARLIAEGLGLPDDRWLLVFQSRFGAQPWLQPYCDETLIGLAKSGVRSVDVICPGFAVDCLETLEEINLTYRELFLNQGGLHYHYIPALNDCELHGQLLQDLIQHHVQPWLENENSVAKGIV